MNFKLTEGVTLLIKTSVEVYLPNHYSVINKYVELKNYQSAGHFNYLTWFKSK